MCTIKKGCFNNTNSKEGVAMKKILSIFVIVISLIFTEYRYFTLYSYAASNNNEVTVENTYIIPDCVNHSNRYVILAINNSSFPIEVTAIFKANGKDGDELQCTDTIEAIEAGQKFILYGSFKQKDLAENPNYLYDITSNKLSSNATTAYDSIELELNKGDNYLQVTGINNASYKADVSVRAIFFDNEKPISFEWVNLATNGYQLEGGSCNTQDLWCLQNFNNWIITYTAVCK